MTLQKERSLGTVLRHTFFCFRHLNKNVFGDELNVGIQKQNPWLLPAWKVEVLPVNLPTSSENWGLTLREPPQEKLLRFLDSEDTFPSCHRSGNALPASDLTQHLGGVPGMAFEVCEPVSGVTWASPPFGARGKPQASRVC